MPLHSNNREIGAFHSLSPILLFDAVFFFFFHFNSSGFVRFKQRIGKNQQAPTYIVLYSSVCCRSLERCAGWMCVLCGLLCASLLSLSPVLIIIRPAICFCQINIYLIIIMYAIHSISSGVDLVGWITQLFGTWCIFHCCYCYYCVNAFHFMPLLVYMNVYLWNPKLMKINFGRIMWFDRSALWDWIYLAVAQAILPWTNRFQSTAFAVAIFKVDYKCENWMVSVQTHKNKQHIQPNRKHVRWLLSIKKCIGDREKADILSDDQRAKELGAIAAHYFPGSNVEFLCYFFHCKQFDRSHPAIASFIVSLNI